MSNGYKKPALIWMLAALLMSANTLKAAPPWENELGALQRVGTADYNYLLWDVYQATLYSETGSYEAASPCALQLEYERELTGVSIAKKSMELIRAQDVEDEMALSRWFSFMKETFPDVEDGTRLTGVLLEDQTSVFYLGEKEIGRILDPEFGKYFFGIWLAPNTSEPELRAQLLGQ